MTNVIIISNQNNPYSGCNYYRAVVPAKYLNKRDDFVVEITDTIPTAKSKDSEGNVIIGLDEGWLEKYDVFAFQRYYKDDPAIFVGIVDWAKQNGKKVVYDADDLLTNIPNHNPVYNDVSGYDVQKLIDYFLKYSTKRSFASLPLADRYAGVSIPNYLDFELWDDVLKHKPQEHDKIRIGYAGGASHTKDLKMIEPILQKFSKQVEFVVVGIDPKWNFKYTYKPFMKTERYPYVLRRLGIDIGICPLEDTEFNKYKSSVKWLEYSAAQIPTIASNVAPYQIINHETTGFIASNENEWEEYLTLLIHDSKLRKRIGRQAYNFVKKRFDIESNLKKWIKIYGK